ncbi:AraC family transcriptional regulator [Marinomonas mediterranea]|jgi:transcriptional regulator, AraC family|uniref:Transcriptional regulator, AraC family n=3 Tax=Marinomonas mediterranea TaxID=119864 RepID=F2K417_MARM1|nr:helix-turn-helix domain-containing protein [Marinomonas mediterranea]ADZ91359.1 transcriptional regulator, AraC family [Marinomonas mediterranea MMB-1]WCN09333.1 helix-turn-helix domain-containing protein [Marinomonas mediterranea]WCN17478.1 helix-turn-helix domain-containing protein [Marinomonas mediterranea MMB-1]
MNDTFETFRENTEKSKSDLSASKRPKTESVIQSLSYRPKSHYQLDLDVFTMADLRLRGSKAKVQTTHRYEFYSLTVITKGMCSQMVDFKSVHCKPGSLLILRPGQAHNYGHDEDWDGWNILFRPEFVLPVSNAPRELKLATNPDRLPEQMFLNNHELQRMTDSIQQMQEDMLIDAPQDDVHALLRHQLYALLARLTILQGRHQTPASLISASSQRFTRFEQLVNERFSDWHKVSDYAAHLGYTEKSLGRAVTAATGVTAKAYITARINLEAKRLLAHTDLPVSTIAERLGFEEATNFSKFFKRETGAPPAEFRLQYQGLV